MDASHCGVLVLVATCAHLSTLDLVVAREGGAGSVSARHVDKIVDGE